MQCQIKSLCAIKPVLESSSSCNTGEYRKTLTESQTLPRVEYVSFININLSITRMTVILDHTLTNSFVCIISVNCPIHAAIWPVVSTWSQDSVVQSAHQVILGPMWKVLDWMTPLHNRYIFSHWSLLYFLVVVHVYCRKVTL